MLLFAILLIGFQAKGQSEEGLLQLLKSEPESRHDSIYYELFKLNNTSTNRQKAKQYCQLAYQQSATYKHFSLQINASYDLASLHDIMHQPDSAIIYLHKAIQLSSVNKLNDWLIYLYNDLGLHHQQLDVYDSALHYFMLSYNLANDNQSYKSQAIASHNIGLVNSYLENYTEAIFYFKDAIAIKTKNQITKGLDLNYINLARVYSEQGNYNEATKQLKKLESDCKSGCDDTILADLYYGLGHCSLKTGATKEAHKLFIKALTVLRKNNDNKQTLANTLFHLSTFSIDSKAYAEALTYLHESEKIAHEIVHRRLLRDIYEQLSIVSDKTGSTSEALHYQTLYVQLKDSIFNEGVANNVKNILLSEQRKQTDVVIEKQETALWKSHILVILLGLVFILMCAVVYLVARSLILSRNYRTLMELEMQRISNDRSNHLKELFRTHMEFTTLLTKVTGFFMAPVTTVSTLANVIKSTLGARELKAVNAISKHCDSMLFILENMNELTLYKNHNLCFEEIDIHVLTEEIVESFKKINSFLVLTVTIKKSVTEKIKSDRTLLLAAVNHAIRYFDHQNENPAVEVIVEQFEPKNFTKITVKHQSLRNILMPYKNQFNHLTVMVSLGKLQGDFIVIQRDDYALFEMTIPNDFDTQDIMAIEKVLSWSN